MKITQLLNEGLRFGQREIKLLKRDAERIKIGIEYEWKLDDMHGAGEPDRDSQEWLEHYDERFNDELMEWRNEYEQELYQESVDSDDLYSFMVELHDGGMSLAHATEHDFEAAELDVDGFIAAVTRIEQGIELLYGLDWSVASSFEDGPVSTISVQIGERHYTFSGDLLTSLENDVDTAYNAFNDITFDFEEFRNMDEDDQEEITDAFRDFVNDELDTLLHASVAHGELDLEDFAGRTFNISSHHLDRLLSQEASELASEEDPDEHTEERMRENAAEYADENTEVTGDAENVMRDLIDDDPDVSEYIDEVDEDGSVAPEGAEAITVPMDIATGIEHMHVMFDFIQRHGYTDNACGMHVNMSFTDIEMDSENLNMLKLMMLLDEEYMRDLYPIRTYVQSNYRHNGLLGVEEFIDMAQAAREVRLSTNNQAKVLQFVEKYVSRHISTNAKYVGVNILGLDDYSSPSTRRVEFRYMGGDDYEKHGEEIEFNIWRYAYILEAAFNPDFARKEYLQALWRWLDDRCEDLFGVSLSDFLKSLERTSEWDDITRRELLNRIRMSPGRFEHIVKDGSRKTPSKVDPTTLFQTYLNSTGGVDFEYTMADAILWLKRKDGRTSNYSEATIMNGLRKIFINAVTENYRVDTQVYRIILAENENLRRYLAQQWWERAKTRSVMHHKHNELLRLAVGEFALNMNRYLEENKQMLERVMDDIGMNRL